MTPVVRFLGIAGALCFLAIRDPLWGAAAVLFEYHNHHEIWWWGDPLRGIFGDLRWTFWISAIALVSLLAHGKRFPYARVFKHPHIILMVALLILMALQLGAINPSVHERWLTKDVKSFLITILIAASACTPGRYRLLIWVLVVGCAGFGLEAWRNPRRDSGRLYGIGGPDTDADNFLAGHLALCVPFVIHFIVRGRKWEKITAFLLGPFILNGIILTSSRGGFLALMVGSGAYLTGSLLDRRVARLAAGLIVAGSFVFFTLVDQVFLDRIATIFGAEDAEQDTTGAGRTEIWKAGMRMVADHPFGSGGGGFQKRSVNYLDRGLLTRSGDTLLRSSHNTLLLVAADYGVHSLLVYLAMVAVIGRMLWRAWRRLEGSDDPGGVGGEALALGAAFLSLMTTSMVGDRLHYDALFWMLGLVSGLMFARQWVEERRAEGEAGLVAIDSDAEFVDGIRLKLVAVALAASLVLLL